MMFLGIGALLLAVAIAAAVGLHHYRQGRRRQALGRRRKQKIRL